MFYEHWPINGLYITVNIVFVTKLSICGDICIWFLKIMK